MQISAKISFCTKIADLAFELQYISTNMQKAPQKKGQVYDIVLTKWKKG